MIPAGLKPLRHQRFRWLWAAGVLSFFGTWIHNVAARWTATTLSPSPVVISLVDALQTFPIVVLSLVAGKLADTLDRRKLLVAINVGLAVVAATLGILSAADELRLVALLTLTALLGAFIALDGPAWQATVPRQVPEDEIHGSVALVSTGYNAARTLGPTVGAWLLISFGATTAFVVDAVTFAVMAVLAWRLLPPSPPVRREQRRAAPTPLRDPTLRKLYGVALVFSLFAMPSMSLLPVVARDSVQGGALSYGALLTAFGIGAVCAGLFVAAAAARLGYPRLVAACSLASGAGLLVQSFSPSLPLALAASGLCGAGWLGAISITNSMVNTSASDQQRGRALAVYFIFAFAGQFAGSLLGGLGAQHLGLGTALQVCAALLAVFAFGIGRSAPLAMSRETP